MTDDIHTCSYHCDRPACIKAQRDEFVRKMESTSQTTGQLIALLRHRDAAGLAKYGTTLDRTDLTIEEWLQHMAEEMLDGAGYALAAMRGVAKLRAELARLEELMQNSSEERCAEAIRFMSFVVAAAGGRVEIDRKTMLNGPKEIIRKDDPISGSIILEAI